MGLPWGGQRRGQPPGAEQQKVGRGGVQARGAQALPAGMRVRSEYRQGGGFTGDLGAAEATPWFSPAGGPRLARAEWGSGPTWDLS